MYTGTMLFLKMKLRIVPHEKRDLGERISQEFYSLKEQAAKQSMGLLSVFNCKWARMAVYENAHEIAWCSVRISMCQLAGLLCEASKLKIVLMCWL